MATGGDAVLRLPVFFQLDGDLDDPDTRITGISVGRDVLSARGSTTGVALSVRHYLTQGLDLGVRWRRDGDELPRDAERC